MAQNNHDRHNGRQNHNWNAGFNATRNNTYDIGNRWNDEEQDRYEYERNQRQQQETTGSSNWDNTRDEYTTGRRNEDTYGSEYSGRNRQDYNQYNDEDRNEQYDSYNNRNNNPEQYRNNAFSGRNSNNYRSNDQWSQPGNMGGQQNEASSYHTGTGRQQDLWQDQRNMGSRNQPGFNQGRYSNSGNGYYGQEEGRSKNNTDWGTHSGKGPKGYSRSDDRIKEDINDRLTYDHELDASDLDITVDQGEVTLSGTVDSRIGKRRAEDIAEAVSGVKNVENRIRIAANANNEPQASTGDSHFNKNRKNAETTANQDNADRKTGKTV